MRIPPDTFAMISGLPGEDLIDRGLRDLEAGRLTSTEALLILIARSRLTQAGLSCLQTLTNGCAAPESRLYESLCAREGESAYGLYNSLKRRLDSFVRSLEQRQGK